MCWFHNGNTQRLTESGFMEKPGIEPATPGLQGIALIHYTTAASHVDFEKLSLQPLLKVIYRLVIKSNGLKKCRHNLSLK